MASLHTVSGWEHTRAHYSEVTDSYTAQLDFNTGISTYL